MVVKKRFNYLIVSALLLAIAGCVSHTVAPISSRAQPPSNKINFHIVSSGETLYSIAWRYGLDHRKLATVNSIRAPYTIFDQQRLTLDLSVTPKSVVVAQRPIAAPKSTPKVKPKPSSKLNPKPKVVSKPSAQTKPVVKRPAVAVALPKTWKWQWPVKGRVVRSYDANKRFKGVHVHASRGTVVKAAAPGIVVYAGNGLHSYGRSIIIKHSDVYLSFYALNRRLLVKEGDRVSVGQKISEVGGDVNNPNRMYFEIRRNGNSTDPIRLLPKQ